MRGLRSSLAVGLSVALGGCSLLSFHWGNDRQIAPRPVTTSGGTALSNGDAYYDRAVAAIARRDYALALDLLQRARAGDATDVRVLNAFGVVYDKLGRFDLSARYYSQALQLDPSSRVVAKNLAYSHQLQGVDAAPIALAGPVAAPPSLSPPPSPETAVPVVASLSPVSPPPPVIVKAETVALLPGPSLAPAAAALPIPASPPREPTVAPAATVIRAAAPTAVAAPRSPALLGRPLDIENASGRPALAHAMSQRLTGRGWTRPRLSGHASRPLSRTVIRFPEDRRAVALALSRTLPGPARLSPCTSPCEGVRLILGADARGWRLSSPAAPLGNPPGNKT